jgi:hypothetical protein
MVKFWKFLMFVCFICFFSQASFAASIKKSLVFELLPNEINKPWSVNIPIALSDYSKIIGRDFNYTVNSTSADFIVEKETISEHEYTISGRLLRLSRAMPPERLTATLNLFIHSGAICVSDIPASPMFVAFTRGQPNFLEWADPGTSARYLHYSIRGANSNVVLAQRIIPIYLTGNRIPVRCKLDENLNYYLTVQLSNMSGKLSPLSIIPIINVKPISSSDKGVSK